MDHRCAESTCQEQIRPEDQVVVAAASRPIGTENLQLDAATASVPAPEEKVVFHAAHWWQRPKMREVTRGLLKDVIEEMLD